ncbi:MAG: hypothetical protein NUV94_07880 [Candidatus Acetothermia bacterium]|jgi:hypothetical protein|nr:hypothetical protein [Candidatus Acetothermia bacterium]
MGASSVAGKLWELLREDPRLAILLGEILGPPPSSGEGPPRPWEA